MTQITVGADRSGKRCENLLINGCECEPYLTCDHRIMVERPDVVLRGAEIVSHILKADACTIGVELNKPDAMKALEGAVGDHTGISVVPLRVKYPQGAEKMLIKAVFGREVPAGKLPLDLDIVVNNVGSMAAVADYFGHVSNRFLITTEGGGASEYLGWGYNADEKWTARGPVKVHVEKLGEWSPLDEREAGDDAAGATGGATVCKPPE